MAISYDNLCAILKEKDMMKTGPVRAIKIGTNAMAKLGKNEDVRVGILIKICTYLECKIDDIIEIVLE